MIHSALKRNINWIGLCFFLSLAFYSHSNEQLFSSNSFKLSLLQSPLPLLPHTPLTPVCPPHLSIHLCLSFTSFLATTNTPSGIQPQMMTPIVGQAQDISKRRINKLLKKGRWRSFKYSRENHQYESISNKEVSRRNPQDSYIHIRETETPKPTSEPAQNIIRETPQASSIGSFMVIPTDKINPSPTSTPPESAQSNRGKPQRTAEETPPPSSPSPPSPHSPPSPPAPLPPPSPSPAQDDIQASDLSLETVSTEEKPPENVELQTIEEVTPIKVDYNPNPEQPSCTDIQNSQTTAQSLCISCHTQESEKTAINKFTETFQDRLEQKKICINDFNLIHSVQDNFNTKCRPISFQTFTKELVCQSCKQNIPPALMLSMMTAESNGGCFILGDDGKSTGLFQINKNSTRIPSCSRRQKDVLKKSNSSTLEQNPQCLENPLINLQESIKILTQKYKGTNNQQSPQFNCQSPDLENISAWKKAVAGYNGGERRIQRLQDLIQTKPTEITQPAWSQMSEWEKIKVYYFSCQRSDVRNCSQETFKNSISNLAHTELVLGVPSLFTSWSQHPDLHNTSHCPNE